MLLKFEDSKGATVSTRLAEYAELENNRSDYLASARDVSEWLLPSRGIYDKSSKSRRVLVPQKVVNPKAAHALDFLVAGLRDGSCPSSMPWFHREFKDKTLNEVKPLKIWLHETTDVLHTELRVANFYSFINSYIKEFCGFCTASIGVFPGKTTTLQFMPLTFGEYVIGTNDQGTVDRLYRTIFMNFHQLYSKFGDGLPESILQKYEEKRGKLDFWYTVLEGVVPEKFMRMPFTRFYALIADGGKQYSGGIFKEFPKRNKYEEFIKVEGVNEFPYPTSRFDILGTDEYGVGPGYRAVPVIKRLQEIVKTNSSAYHLSVKPPWNIPVSMKGRSKLYPDGHNYYINPDEIIRAAQDVRFDHTSAEVSEQKLEKCLGEIFFNDVFLTGSRDANASPLKARQVDEISDDKWSRISTPVEQLFFEGLNPILERSSGIIDRAGKFPPMPEGFEDIDTSTSINFTSILAQKIKERAFSPMLEYLQLVSGVSQFDQNAMDIPDTDEFLYNAARIKNLNPRLTRSPKEVAKRRKDRQEAMQAKENEAKEMAQQAQQVESESKRASAVKDMSVAGANLSDNFGSSPELV